jgi:hypothetical protein
MTFVYPPPGDQDPSTSPWFLRLHYTSLCSIKVASYRAFREEVSEVEYVRAAFTVTAFKNRASKSFESVVTARTESDSIKDSVTVLRDAWARVLVDSGQELVEFLVAETGRPIIGESISFADMPAA